MKNYVGFVNDHSGSMGNIARTAVKDYNDNITAVRNAANAEMMDTVVSVVGFGIGRTGVTRQVTVSNPHVLKPIKEWSAQGMTPMYDAIGDMVEMLSNLPDSKNPDVSFLVQVTTDGDENDSKKHNRSSITQLIQEKMRDGRWTFVGRVPNGASNYLTDIGFPFGNVLPFETTSKGLEAASVATQSAISNFYVTRSTGAKSSTVFYADAATVDTQSLVDITSKVSLYVVPTNDSGIQIRDFILRHRMEYLKGAAFYQLTKTEARVSHTKLILVRDRTTGKIYGGKEARQMIGLPTNGNARLHPGDHKNYDLFIQSESVNRKLVGDTGVVYWKEQGVTFTQEELDRFNGVAKAPVAPAVVTLPKVAPTNKPTKSPIPVTPKAAVASVDGKPVKFFAKRDEARAAGSVKDIRNFSLSYVVGNTLTQRWFVFI